MTDSPTANLEAVRLARRGAQAREQRPQRLAARREHQPVSEKRDPFTEVEAHVGKRAAGLETADARQELQRPTRRQDADRRRRDNRGRGAVSWDPRSPQSLQQVVELATHTSLVEPYVMCGVCSRGCGLCNTCCR